MHIKVRVETDAREEEVIKETLDRYSVSIREPAERNLANARILAIFRKRFPRKHVRIMSGHHSPSKVLSVE